MAGEREGLAPRRAALAVLADVRQGRPFEQALDRALEPLPEADRRLAHELAAGVLRRQQTLDDAWPRWCRADGDRSPGRCRICCVWAPSAHRARAGAGPRRGGYQRVAGQRDGRRPRRRVCQRGSAPLERAGAKRRLRRSRGPGAPATGHWQSHTRIPHGWWNGGSRDSGPRKPSSCLEWNNQRPRPGPPAGPGERGAR